MSYLEDFIKAEGTVFPGKTYIEELLKPVFNDQRDYLFDSMFDIHRAHIIMLKEQQIISSDEAKRMLEGTNIVAKTDPSLLTYRAEYEDLFFMMEAKIAEVIGPELAGKIHIARSRNDMGVAMYRLVLREYFLKLLDSCYRLSEILSEQAEQHAETYITGYTHTQPAQPTTLGHYFLAIYDVLQRDIKRLLSAYETVNRSPLGAAAMTTTGFPISRVRTCELLGFEGIVENSYDAIAGADYLLETSAALMICMVNTGRWIQDFLQQVTREYGTFTVADPYVQVSSIMPQKRNPVSIEHSRALASSAISEAQAVMNMIHNTPFGDIVDTEDDLQPHLYRAFNKANRVMKLLHAVIVTLKVNKGHAKEMAEKSCITITELADTLARDYGIGFRKAHEIASFIAKKTAEEEKELPDWKVEEVNIMLQSFVNVTLTEKAWNNIISPVHFVKIRSISGGPSPNEVLRMIAERKKWLVAERKKFEKIVQKLKEKRKFLCDYSF
ncbi:argininosuccinate lyase [Bacillus xiapuensis]|uniref:Argininosuccinate lyase n=1 Tax=Bacillus xiapuensis TaxID=2014075 RepID=A0ABU6NCJ7_9BACI|nr:argininosuccinate lyase [Bacillus xiapuensis]